MSILRVAAVSAFVLALGLSPVARASTVVDETFYFTGACSDCGAGGGSGTASATLVLQNYTLGNTLENTNFVSLAYTSPLMGTLTVDTSVFVSFGENGFQSVISSNLPGPQNVHIYWTLFTNNNNVEHDYELATSAAGPNWFLSENTYNLNLDNGTDLGTWSSSAATPLPATLPLFATGLGAFGLLGWRRKRKSKVTV